VDRADDIARRSAADTVVELGSGTSEETRILLTALAAPPRLVDRSSWRHRRVDGSFGGGHRPGRSRRAAGTETSREIC